jgi:hypothetical protein
LKKENSNTNPKAKGPALLAAMLLPIKEAFPPLSILDAYAKRK